jgi:hypothetical protein
VSKGLGGLIVAMMVVEDMDHYVDKCRARRAERLALKTNRVPRAVSSGVRPDPGALGTRSANCHAVHRSAAS